MPRLSSLGLLAPKLQRRQAGRLNAKTTYFSYLAFELCNLIFWGLFSIWCVVLGIYLFGGNSILLRQN
jgi:hypothetical protein